MFDIDRASAEQTALPVPWAPPPLPSPVERAPVPVERAPVPSPVSGYMLPLGGGFISAGWGTNWWQRGYSPLPPQGSAVVYACVAAYAQTVAMCPGTHWMSTGNGGRRRVNTSALSRVLKKPNNYQSISDFLLNLTATLYGDGNAYALALRNNRFEIAELHLMDPRACATRIAVTGEVFYSLGGNPIIEAAIERELLNVVPARDVLHVRLNTPRHPLLGEPPLSAAPMEVAASTAVMAQNLNFAINQGRPSGVIETELGLTREQIDDVRQRWNDQAQGFAAGGTPILTRGLKWQQVTVNSRDAQLAELLELSDQHIAGVYRVPLALLNLQSGQGPQGSTESLMQFWVATGLGFALSHIEEAFGRVFGLGGLPDDYLELDTSALLRSAFKDRMEGLARAVQGGIYAPNEARATEELDAMPFGDEPRVQQQVVPLSAWSKAPPATPAPDAPPAAPPQQGATDGGDRAWTASDLLAAADEYDRRRAA